MMLKSVFVPSEYELVEAEGLLKNQKSLWQTLEERFQSKPQLGIYHDERPKDSFTTFRCFVCHVRQCVSRSPRTVLRQALNQAVQKAVRPNQD